MSTSQTMSMAQMQAEYVKLLEENARLKANKTTTNGIKVSEKGAVSVYGLGRFPVTLYSSQWNTLISMVPQIQEFMAANKAVLKEKPAAH